MSQAKEILIIVLSWVTGLAFVSGGIIIIMNFYTQAGLLTVGIALIPAGISIIAFVLGVDIKYNYIPHKEEEILSMQLERKLRSKQDLTNEQVEAIIKDVEFVIKSRINSFVDEAVQELITSITNVEVCKECLIKIEQVRKDLTGIKIEAKGVVGAGSWTDTVGGAIPAKRTDEPGEITEPIQRPSSTGDNDRRRVEDPGAEKPQKFEIEEIERG